MEYKIIRSKRKTLCVEVKNSGEVIVRAPFLISRQKIEYFISAKQRWIENALKKQALKKQAAEAMQLTAEETDALKAKAKVVLTEKAERFAAVMGVRFSKITVRKQKTRWGSCSNKGNLNFNCLLMLMPDDIIDYVVVHELAHLKYMNHSPAFWSQVQAVLPDYRLRRKKLKEETLTG